MEGLIEQPFVGTVIIFTQIVVINVALSGDNAIVVGMAAAGLPAHQRARALWLGIGLATALCILFSLVATLLLHVVGLLFAGGILLLWVCWKLWRELTTEGRREEVEAEAVLEGQDVPHPGPRKRLSQAIWQIIAADVSMSLDNVLAVAGASLEHPILMSLGFAMSVLLRGLAALLIARLLERHRWIAFLGLAIIVYVALKMIWVGASDMLDAVAGTGLGQRIGLTG